MWHFLGKKKITKKSNGAHLTKNLSYDRRWGAKRCQIKLSNRRKKNGISASLQLQKWRNVRGRWSETHRYTYTQRERHIKELLNSARLTQTGKKKMTTLKKMKRKWVKKAEYLLSLQSYLYVRTRKAKPPYLKCKNGELKADRPKKKNRRQQQQQQQKDQLLHAVHIRNTIGEIA